jgi:hypothetical protein
MRCANCGAESGTGDAFCGNCGARLPHYVQATEVRPERRSGLLLLVVALAAGLLVGGIVFWRFYQGRGGTQQAANAPALSPHSQSAPEQPETAPAPPEPQTPPEVAATPEKTERPAKPRKEPEQKPAVAESDTKTEAPQLTSQGTEPAAAPPSAPAHTAPASAPNTPPKRAGRPAVQESESESAPMPTVAAPPANAPAPQPPAPIPAAPVTPAPAPPATPVPAAPAKPAYTGPRSGVAFWSGKLEKGQTLTINGGSASIGAFSGAPLPGVPVHITVDQTNLGFGEMPNAANGFRTLVLRSHSKHDKLTIRWEVAH